MHTDKPFFYMQQPGTSAAILVEQIRFETNQNGPDVVGAAKIIRILKNGAFSKSKWALFKVFGFKSTHGVFDKNSLEDEAVFILRLISLCFYQCPVCICQINKARHT